MSRTTRGYQKGVEPTTIHKEYKLTSAGSDITRHVACDLGLRHRTKDPSAVFAYDVSGSDPYTDRTSASAASDTDAYSPFPTAEAQNDALYIGMSVPFCGILPVMGTQGIDGGTLAIAFEYLADVNASTKAETWYDLNETDDTTNLTLATATTVNAATAATDTEITLSSVANLPEQGVVLLNSLELVFYRELDTTNVAIKQCERGAFGTTAAAYTNEAAEVVGMPVKWVMPTDWTAQKIDFHIPSTNKSNEQGPFYWVRIRITTADYTTNPTLTNLQTILPVTATSLEIRADEPHDLYINDEVTKGLVIKRDPIRIEDELGLSVPPKVRLDMHEFEMFTLNGLASGNIAWISLGGYY